MAFIAADPDADADPHTRAVYDRQARAFGYLPNYAQLFSHRPQVIDLWAELQQELRRHVSPRLFELVTFAAALALRSSYCSLAHGCRLREYFCDTEIEQLAAGRYQSIVSAAEAAAMRYAARVAVDANSVSEADMVLMRAAGLSDAEIFDIAAIAAGRAFFSKLVEGLGARPDAAYARLPEHLQAVLTVGRSIEQAGDPIQRG